MTKKSWFFAVVYRPDRATECLSPEFGCIWLFCLLLMWRFIGIWKPERLPTFPIIILLIVCGMAIIYSQHRGFLGRDGGTSLFVIALGLKLMEIKTERDLYLIN